mmetsp:Transcript_9850/g.18538  ORF Transcript_9850/g.18538 Transcript_9850/m.18538 type:complete len:246 (-) Transcript_9850:1540-2277(-)
MQLSRVFQIQCQPESRGVGFPVHGVRNLLLLRYQIGLCSPLLQGFLISIVLPHEHFSITTAADKGVALVADVQSPDLVLVRIKRVDALCAADVPHFDETICPCRQHLHPERNVTDLENACRVTLEAPEARAVINGPQPQRLVSRGGAHDLIHGREGDAPNPPGVASKRPDGSERRNAPKLGKLVLRPSANQGIVWREGDCVDVFLVSSGRRERIHSMLLHALRIRDPGHVPKLYETVSIPRADIL